VLHSIRSLLCTATNATPHERMFLFPRKSASMTGLPSWLTSPGIVLLWKHVRGTKTDPLVERVHLLHANPQYAYIAHPDGREETISIKDLAPSGAPPTPAPQHPTPLPSPATPLASLTPDYTMLTAFAPQPRPARVDTVGGHRSGPKPSTSNRPDDIGPCITATSTLAQIDQTSPSPRPLTAMLWTGTLVLLSSPLFPPTPPRRTSFLNKG